MATNDIADPSYRSVRESADGILQSNRHCLGGLIIKPLELVALKDKYQDTQLVAPTTSTSTSTSPSARCSSLTAAPSDLSLNIHTQDVSKVIIQTPWLPSASVSTVASSSVSDLLLLEQAFSNLSHEQSSQGHYAMTSSNQHYQQHNAQLLAVPEISTHMCTENKPSNLSPVFNDIHKSERNCLSVIRLSHTTLRDLEDLHFDEFLHDDRMPSTLKAESSSESSSSSQITVAFHKPANHLLKVIGSEEIESLNLTDALEHKESANNLPITSKKLVASHMFVNEHVSPPTSINLPWRFNHNDMSKLQLHPEKSELDSPVERKFRSSNDFPGYDITSTSTRCLQGMKNHVRTTESVTTDLIRGRDEAKKGLKQESQYPAHITVLPSMFEHPQKKSKSDTYKDEKLVDGDDTASEPEDEQPTKPRKLSQRKAVERLVLQAYVKSVIASEEAAAPKEFDKLEEHTTKWLVKHGSDTIITTPREYQIELFELAKKKNVIAVLDTGSGKTLIAVLLLKHVFDQELESRTRGEPKKISFFLVNSVQLVFQQHNVLSNNLMGHPMERFCGGMNSDLWDKRKWKRIHEDYMVVVCTADVLFQALHHGYITIPQINILIFDEAHHAKKGNVYARIIKDFYTAEPDLEKRPKIFGMTASPVDSKTNVHTAATQLEKLLHAQIITASNPKLMQYAPTAKKEEIMKYHALRPPLETSLFRQLKATISCDVLSKQFTYAKQAFSELGSWCADHVWSMCMSEEQCRKLEANIERKFHQKNTAEPIALLDARKAEIRQAKSIIDSHIFSDPKPRLDDLSSKVVELMHYLQSRYNRQSSDKCIVFVNQRYTAIMLVALFRKPGIGTPFLHPGFLVGQQTDDLRLSNDDGVQFSASNFRAQLLTLSKFRRGQFNVLFATSVAEEGLDIPDCNVVVRFDLCTTMIQYIQSRGRARLDNSRYIHMIENGNQKHKAIILEVNNSEKTFRHYCQNLDENRLLSGNDTDRDVYLDKEKKHRRYKEPKTGSVLTYRLSLMVLESFATSLSNNRDSTQNIFYNIIMRGKEFMCEVVLPSNSPVSGAIGRAYSTKQVAKCSAAFEACLALRKSGHLNEHFISTYQKTAPAMRNALLAVSGKKQTRLKMRTKPEIWFHHSTPHRLFLTILVLSDPNHLKRPSQPLGLLTRTRLPDFPEFPLHFGSGKSSMVKCFTLNLPMDVSMETLRLIDNFTLRIFDDMFSKVYESDLEKMPYWLVPVHASVQKNVDDGEFDKATLAKDVIVWELIELFRDKDVLEMPLDLNAQPEWFEDRFIVDVYDGSRKFYTVKQAHHLKPLDPLPSDITPRSGVRRNNSNIKEYSISLWAKSRLKRDYKDEQPVIQAELLGLRRNLLDDTEQADATIGRKCFIVLEPLRISIIPTTVVAMGFVFPAIIHRLESYLIAVEVCSKLGFNVRADMALEAVTKDSDNTEEHRYEQIQFQRGMGKNYERLEFLGDSFLKMAASIALYGLHPESNEQEFHIKRMIMICNQNLLNVANKLNLYEYIRSQGFNRRAWYPKGLKQTKGKLTTAPTTHDLNDKTIADVSEALIGATYLSSGIDAAVYAVRVLVDSADHPMKCWADYYEAYNMPRYQTAPATASQIDMAAQIYAIHPYKFKHPRILRSAFTHSSYPRSYEEIPHYQRLEFLGDAVFDMAAINYLFHAYPERDPQWLTEHKMAMVSNQFLGALCVHLGLHRYLQHFMPVIQSSIVAYVDDIHLAREAAEADAVRDGKRASELSPDWWITAKTPPKCLPDIVEAYVGAIFVDSQYSYAEVEAFFNAHVLPFFHDMRIYDTYANKHPVTFLTRFLEDNMGCRRFTCAAQELPDLGDGMPVRIIAMVLIHERRVCHKEGGSVRYAKVAVAKLAMESLKSLSLVEFRERYGCDCYMAGGTIAEERQIDRARYSSEVMNMEDTIEGAR